MKGEKERKKEREMSPLNHFMKSDGDKNMGFAVNWAAEPCIPGSLWDRFSLPARLGRNVRERAERQYWSLFHQTRQTCMPDQAGIIH